MMCRLSFSEGDGSSMLITDVRPLWDTDLLVRESSVDGRLSLAGRCPLSPISFM